MLPVSGVTTDYKAREIHVAAYRREAAGGVTGLQESTEKNH